MGTLSAAELGPQVRLVLLDTEGEAAGFDCDALSGLLADARRQGLSVAHCYRAPDSARVGGPAPAKGLAPLKGLSPLPNEPVFLRSGPDAFSDRSFAAWLGSAQGAVVFMGGTEAATACAEAAADLGHAAYLMMQPANSNGAFARPHQFYPHVTSRVSVQAPEFARTVISYIPRGSNGQG